METLITRYIAMSLDYFAAFMLTLILICYIPEKNKTKLFKVYIRMATSCVISLLLEAISFTVNFIYPDSGDKIRFILNNAAIIGGYFLAYTYVCYVSNLIGFENKLCQKVVKILRIIGVVATAFLIVGGQFGKFFTVTKGDFINGDWFVGVFAYDILSCLVGILLIVKYSKILKLRDIIALSSLPILIFVSAVFQYVGYGTIIGLFFMSAISLFIIYLMIQVERNRQEAEREKQLTDMNVSLMLSQIQPHFLYNALSSIRRMIRKNPMVAESAIENFSMYLRQNLESMNKVEPIPFSQELQHLQEYLYLEKLRFGERLQVEYDLQYENFALPVLTLQPIVENAIKHGILKKEEGGYVKISTCRKNGLVLLTVEDNGVGFTPTSFSDDKKTHIGFSNVKSRIEIQCQGSVNLESEVGVGTTVTITIPII